MRRVFFGNMRILSWMVAGVLVGACRSDAGADKGDAGGGAVGEDGGSTAADDTATPPVDADGDGFAASDDCDDTDASVHPGADELCNGVDDDCDGDVDEDAVDVSVWYADADGDGYGDVSASETACEAPSEYVSDATDCDDTDASVHPAADEFCNGCRSRIYGLSLVSRSVETV